MTTDHDPFEDQVRRALAEKAASVRPSSGGDAGLDAIRRKLTESPAATGRRSFPVWLSAAAAVVVIALVGGVLVTRDDDGPDETEVAAGEGDAAAGTAALLDAVWPTDDRSELASMDDPSLDDPASAAAAYLSERLGRLLPADAIEIDGMTATLRDDAAAPTVELGSLDGTWYVHRATTDLLAVDVAMVEGEIRGTVVPSAAGDLTVIVDDVEAHRAFADADVPVSISAPSDGRAVVRSTLVGDAGNATFDERLVTGGFTAYPTLDAVWPTDDPEVLRGISASWAREDSPLEAARLYLQSRLGSAPTNEGLVVDGQTVRDTEETDTVVHLERLDGEIWYVQRATSERLDVEVAYDGERVVGQVVTSQGGEMSLEVFSGDGAGTGAGTSAMTTAGEPVEIDVELASGGAPIVLRTTVSGDVGIVGLDERRLLAPPDAPASPPDDPEEPALGVWPKPADQIPADVLADPVDTAARYIEETAGASNGVVLSDFRQGDSNSGEVEVTGDYEATIALRQVEGRWHVEAVHTPQVEARGDVPGELWLHANEEGLLSVTVLDPWGTVVQSMPGKHMAEGEEVVVVPAEPVHKPFTVRYRFEPTAGGGFGLGDVAVAGTHEQAGTGEDEDEVHDVPDEAIHAAGGLDPIGTAQGYIEARLGFWPDGMVLNEGFSGEDNATVDWPYGSVFLVHHGGYWYVTESVGASVSFDSIDLPTVQVFLGEEGIVEVQLLDAEGGECAAASTEVDGRGPATVTFDDVPCDVESVVAVMNEVIAEKAV